MASPRRRPDAVAQPPLSSAAAMRAALEQSLLQAQLQAAEQPGPPAWRRLGALHAELAQAQPALRNLLAAAAATLPATSRPPLEAAALAQALAHAHLLLHATSNALSSSSSSSAAATSSSSSQAGGAGAEAKLVEAGTQLACEVLTGPTRDGATEAQLRTALGLAPVGHAAAAVAFATDAVRAARREDAPLLWALARVRLAQARLFTAGAAEAAGGATGAGGVRAAGEGDKTTVRQMLEEALVVLTRSDGLAWAEAHAALAEAHGRPLLEALLQRAITAGADALARGAGGGVPFFSASADGRRPDANAGPSPTDAQLAAAATVLRHAREAQSLVTREAMKVAWGRLQLWRGAALLLRGGHDDVPAALVALRAAIATGAVPHALHIHAFLLLGDASLALPAEVKQARSVYSKTMTMLPPPPAAGPLRAALEARLAVAGGGHPESGGPVASVGSPAGRAGASGCITPLRKMRKSGSGLTRQKRRELINRFTCSLSAVLNDPRRPRQIDLLTRDWGDAFVPGPATSSRLLPNVPSKQIVAVRQKYKEVSARRGRVRPLRPTPVSSDIETSEVDDADEDVTTLVIAAGVPEIFLKEAFDLSDPGYFKKVILPKDANEDLRVNSQQRQTKLSHYLDIVESHLTAQLSQRADRIFAAMSTHEALGTSVIDARQGVVTCRQAVQTAQQQTSAKHLNMLRLLTQRQNCRRLVAHLDTLRAVTSSQSSIQHLLAASDYVGALDLIRTTQEIVDSELKGIHALRHLTSQLDEISSLISKMLVGDFLSILLQRVDRAAKRSRAAMKAAATQPQLEDVKEDVSNGTPVAGDGMTGADASDAEDEVLLDDDDMEETPEDFHERLVPLLQGIVQQGCGDVISQYWSKLETRLRTIVKETVLGFLDEQRASKASEQGAPPSPAARNALQLASWGDALRELNFDVWIKLLDRLFARLLSILRALVASRDTIAAILEPLRVDATSAAAIEEDAGRPCRGAFTSVAEEGAVSPPGTTHATSSTVREGGEMDAGNDDDDEMEGFREEDPAHLESEGVEADLSELDASKTGASPAAAALREQGEETSSQTPALRKSSVAGLARLSTRTSASDLEEKAQWARLSADNKAAIEKAVEEVHQRCSKLIQARSRDGADTGLASSSFIVYYHKSDSFISNSEEVSGQNNALLRGTLQGQARAFLEQFHARQTEKLRMILNNEHWIPADVPSECQDIVARLEKADTKVAKEGHTKDKLQAAGQSFTAVGALLMFIQTVSEYCTCLKEMPALAQDILRKLYELLRLFNNQINRLVLKAEAMHVVGLKRITAKQLALSSQTLTAVQVLIPSVAARCSETLTERQKVMLTEFDKVTEDYRKHRQGIIDKLVAIMRDVWSRSSMDMSWHKAESTPGIKTVASSTAKLHKALSGVMSTAELENVFSAVVAMINSRLVEAAEGLQGSRDKAALVGLAADVVYLEQQFGKLEAVPIARLRDQLENLHVVLPPRVGRASSTST